MLPYSEMSIADLRAFIAEKGDERDVLNSAIRSAQSVLGDKIKAEAQTLVASLPRDQRDALIEALQKGSLR